jgi:hypothetical protein
VVKISKIHQQFFLFFSRSMEADALWGVGASDSAELRGHIKYLMQQELRTASVNREAWSGTHMVARAPRASRAARDKHPRCARALTWCAPALDTHRLALIAGLSKHEGVRFGAAGMDILDSDSISEEEFNARYAAPGRPCMVRGATEKWRAADRWKSAQVSND